MFARTPRLLLRPGFPEDAPALARALADRSIARNLSAVPWPYSMRDAEAFLAVPRDPILPSLLIFERTSAEPRLVGACGLARKPSGTIMLGYWVARADWGRGIATEAGQAVIGMAEALRLPNLTASYFLDNPASGRVLEKLGFAPTGMIAPQACRARGEDVPARVMRLQLSHAAASVPEEALAA